MTKFVSSTNSLYLPGNENIVKPEDIGEVRKINQTLKIHKLGRKYVQSGQTYLNYLKIPDDKDLFRVLS